MTEDDVIETFNRNLAETGALGARRAAAREIERMSGLRTRLFNYRNDLRLSRNRLVTLNRDAESSALEYAIEDLDDVLTHIDQALAVIEGRL